MLKIEWIEKLFVIKNKYTGSDILIRTQLLEGSHLSGTIVYSIVKFSTKEQSDLIVIGNVDLDVSQKLKP